MTAESPNGSRDAICLWPAALDARSIAAEMYRRTCRVDFDAPGFCVVRAGSGVGSVAFRQLMVDVKRELAAIHESTVGNSLAYLSADRFDQQSTTRLHLDGGPDESLLMLGYEPSVVDSEMVIADYAKCACDFGLSPEAFLSRHNPMFAGGADILRPYTVRVPCFPAGEYRIVCINNSCAPYSRARPVWQGVLHGATIPYPDPSACRVINSTLITSVPAGTPDTVDVQALADFVATSDIRPQ